MKKPLIVIAGPTAAGKTNISIQLAQRVGGEIISADSMQVYKGMDIGSAKITPQEMQGIKHYGIDILDPREDYNVTLFQKMAKSAMNEIYPKGKIPILVGGTGFYIQSVVYDIDFTESEKDEEETSVRAKYEGIAQEENGMEKLYFMLTEIDPKSCEKIPMQNVKRVIRALEFHELTGKLISEHNEEQRQKESPYNTAFFVITDDRETLYKRIDQRVDLMIKNGLVEEVDRLRQIGLTKDDVSMQGLGYKEILQALDGEITMEDAVYIIKRDTRHFAKRQLTWFRREKEVVWIDRSVLKSESNMLEKMQTVLQEMGI